jgi:beta-galactosidase
VSVGTPVIIGVGATGTAPLSYRWRIDGAAVPGATGPTISSPGGVTLDDDGPVLDVVVRNAAGTVTSAQATLTVVDSD